MTLPWILSALAFAGALGLVAFESPVRVAVAYGVALLGITGLCAAAGQPLLAALLLWILGAGGGLLIALLALLLNLAREEAGERRFRIGKAFAAGFVLLAIAKLWPALPDAVRAGPAASPPAVASPEPSATPLSTALFTRHAIPTSTLALGLSLALVGALVLSRRRA